MIRNYYLAEYSINQNCFHIKKLSELLKINRANAIHKVDNDYHLIGIFETYDEASEFIKNSRSLIQGQEYVDKLNRVEE